MTSTEREVRARLGVPETASSIMILGMDAHMDWDWLNTFQTLVDTGNGYPQGSVQEIISQAWNLMINNQGTTSSPPYFYSVCEMGFLRAALELNPDLVTQYQQYTLSQQLNLEGGGITSPDNLLPHGEAFLRNYLVGNTWQNSVLGLTPLFAYMPDDFGHDAQLPVMLEALGFMGVSFSRIPGSWASSQTTPIDGSTSLYQQLMTQGADLYWQAKDGSTVLAHLEQHGYQQGNALKDDCGDPSSAISQLQTWLGQNQPSSPSPYIYLPCGDDFALPIPCLLDIATAWNNQSPAPTTAVAVGTLQQYMALVQAWSIENPGKLLPRTMDPTPYWTGFYASRPALKILHHATVRALLGAEVFGTIADLLQVNDALAWAPVAAARQQAVLQGWEALLPSTHHDYITGTAVDSVYSEEQLPLLRAARNIAVGARRTAMQEIATLIDASPSTDEIPVAVFNQNGFTASGLTEIHSLPGRTVRSVRSESGDESPVQVGADGNLLFMASAQSLGYSTYYLSNAEKIDNQVSAVLSGGETSVTMKSSTMQLVISQNSAWGITSLQPIVNGVLQPDLIPTGDAANTLAFYKDLGNIYNFGNEFAASGLSLVTGKITPGKARVIENGPLRARVEATFAFSDGNPNPTSTEEYTIEYTLVAGEPFVRIAVTGSVPLPPNPENGGTPYAVMVRFPFAGSGGAAATVDGIVRGTPYHWYDQLPTPYWQGPTFQATHNFVVPSSGGTTLGAIYHADVPAWAIDDDGVLIGCILRNTPATYPWPPAPEGRGANGIDTGIYTRRYALRVPQGLNLPPSSVAIFEESIAYATPLLSTYINVPYDGVSPQHPVNVSFPTSFSLASIQSGNAIITTAKEGEIDPTAMMLRIYQPSNTSQDVTVSLSGYIQAIGDSSPQVTPVTAMEQPISGASSLPVTNDTFTLTMNRALATVEVV